MPVTDGNKRAGEIKAAGNLPGHIAIIMDGNGRWARKRGLPRIQGHRAGRKGVREAVEGCVELGIGVLTLYTFSVENWSRPEREVSALMRFLHQTLKEEREELKKNGVRLGVIGRVSDLPKSVQRVLNESIDCLKEGKGLLLNLALSYGGRAEIVDAVKRILSEASVAGTRPELIDEKLIESRLYTSGLPDPDLLIRTSGEMRLSNFLLWQLAYSEMWVTDTLWPDFRKKHLFEAVRDYQKRERRFGRID
ncbi:MAG: isoprenyl transferase [Candidatus Eisenbacteria bacterium]|nr:isoprenyl transferase [Candidatus Eisenbacteria bacterium]